jgi:hypothetical protein
MSSPKPKVSSVEQAAHKQQAGRAKRGQEDTGSSSDVSLEGGNVVHGFDFDTDPKASKADTGGASPLFEGPSTAEVNALAAKIMADIEEARERDERCNRRLLAIVEALKPYDGREISRNAKKIEEKTGGKLDYIAGMVGLKVDGEQYLLGYGNQVDCEQIMNKFNSWANSGVKDREAARLAMDPNYPYQMAALILALNKATKGIADLSEREKNYQFPSVSKYIVDKSR